MLFQPFCHMYYNPTINVRSTPVECLHTLLLGAYKYLFADLMKRVTPSQKNEISANIDDFPSSGMVMKLNCNAPK